MSQLSQIKYQKSLKLDNGDTSVPMIILQTQHLTESNPQKYFYWNGLELIIQDEDQDGLNMQQTQRILPILANSLIVIGGKLENSDVGENQIYSIVLPAKYKITRLIFKNFNQTPLHYGLQNMLLSKVRQRDQSLKPHL